MKISAKSAVWSAGHMHADRQQASLIRQPQLTANRSQSPHVLLAFQEGRQRLQPGNLGLPVQSCFTCSVKWQATSFCQALGLRLCATKLQPMSYARCVQLSLLLHAVQHPLFL